MVSNHCVCLFIFDSRATHTHILSQNAILLYIIIFFLSLVLSSSKGGSKARARTARKIVDGGVAVMGHVGLTPQAISVIGGFRAQGRTAYRARELVDDALRLQDAGVFAIVLECVPAVVATAITETLEIPTIGIGAGGGTSGQVLVFHDMLGMTSHPHHAQFVPKFCKPYAQLGHIIDEGLQSYREEVETGIFPGNEYSPYVMKDDERIAFEHLLAQDAEERQRRHDRAAEEYTRHDEYEKLHLYGGPGGGPTEDGAAGKK
jgi:3-methyl-2-oxobutanoate hydroxymethyltransferase